MFTCLNNSTLFGFKDTRCSLRDLPSFWIKEGDNLYYSCCFLRVVYMKFNLQISLSVRLTLNLIYTTTSKENLGLIKQGSNSIPAIQLVLVS